MFWHYIGLKYEGNLMPSYLFLLSRWIEDIWKYLNAVFKCTFTYLNADLNTAFKCGLRIIVSSYHAHVDKEIKTVWLSTIWTGPLIWVTQFSADNRQQWAKLITVTESHTNTHTIDV